MSECEDFIVWLKEHRQKESDLARKIILHVDDVVSIVIMFPAQFVHLVGMAERQKLASAILHERKDSFYLIFSLFF